MWEGGRQSQTCFHGSSRGSLEIILEVALHAGDADRDAVDERKRLRVLRKNRRKHT